MAYYQNSHPMCTFLGGHSCPSLLLPFSYKSLFQGGHYHKVLTSTIVFELFLYMEKRSSFGQSPLVKAIMRTLSSTSLIRKIFLLNQAINDLKLSSSCYLMRSKFAKKCLCICPPMKWVTNRPLSSLKDERKAQHIISYGMPWKCMRVMKDLR